MTWFVVGIWRLLKKYNKWCPCSLISLSLPNLWLYSPSNLWLISPFYPYSSLFFTGKDLVVNCWRLVDSSFFYFLFPLCYLWWLWHNVSLHYFLEWISNGSCWAPSIFIFSLELLIISIYELLMLPWFLILGLTFVVLSWLLSSSALPWG